MTTIQVALFEGSKKVEEIGEYVSLDEAVKDVTTVLQEIAPDAKTSVKYKGKVQELEPGSIQTVRAIGTPFLVTLTVLDDDHHEPSLVETVPETSPEEPAKAPAKVKKASGTKAASKYPDPILVGDKKWWGCDQHTVLQFIETHPQEVKEHGIELRKRGGKFALVCDKITVWTCSYEAVAKYATQVAQEQVEQLKAA